MLFHTRLPSDYSDGEFIKQCLTDVAAVMCPQSVKEFEKISLSRWTVARRIDSLSEDISQSLSDKIKDFVAWTFATDESTISHLALNSAFRLLREPTLVVGAPTTYLDIVK